MYLKKKNPWVLRMFFQKIIIYLCKGVLVKIFTKTVDVCADTKQGDGYVSSVAD